VDVVLADVVMPGMNGTQLADRLTSEFPGLPIILMSAFAPAGLGRVGFREAVIPVLQKPFDAGHLGQIIDSTLQRDRVSGPVPAVLGP
jgi:FixJ family two-component response regulator